MSTYNDNMPNTLKEPDNNYKNNILNVLNRTKSKKRSKIKSNNPANIISIKAKEKELDYWDMLVKNVTNVNYNESKNKSKNKFLD